MLRFALAGRVSTEDLQDPAPAVRGRPRTYLLRGLLRCGLCGRAMEGAWNNGRADYRCTAWHAREHLVDGKMRNVFVREDAVTAQLGTFLVRLLARPGVPFEEVDVPRGSAAQVAACRERGLALTYDPVEGPLSTGVDAEEIVVRL